MFFFLSCPFPFFSYFWLLHSKWFAPHKKKPNTNRPFPFPRGVRAGVIEFQFSPLPSADGTTVVGWLFIFLSLFVCLFFFLLNAAVTVTTDAVTVSTSLDGGQKCHRSFGAGPINGFPSLADPLTIPGG